MAQIAKGIQEYFSWIIDSINQNLDITSFVGTSPEEPTPPEPQSHDLPVKEQLIEDLASTEPSVLTGILGHARDAMELIQNGLNSSMEYNTGTMVASRHHGRKLVLNHCTQVRYADHIEQIEHPGYNSEQLFGDMPLSAHHLWWTQRKEVGHIYVKGGPVPKEIDISPPPKKGKGKYNYNQQGKRSSYTHASSNASQTQSGKFRLPGNNYQQGNKKRAGGAKQTANQKRATQQNTPNSAKTPNSKKGGKKIIPLPTMREYCPSRGDVPPSVGTFPPPVVVPEPGPPGITNFPLVRPWTLSKDLSLKERWESLRFPHSDGKGGTLYKMDQVAVDLAINGLKIIWLKPPPMSSRDQPPVHIITSRSKSLSLLPVVEK